MKIQSTLFILFVLITSQMITKQSIAQSNYNDYSSSQRTDIFFDDFDDNQHEWPYIQDGETWTGKIANGYMYYESKGNTSIYQARNVTLNEREDFELEARFRHAGGATDQSDGFDWGRNADGHRDSFGFSGNGQYLISRYDGTWSNDIPWTSSALVNKTTYNKLTVRKVQSTYYFFLNERLVHTMPFRPLKGHAVGFSINANITIHVDFLRVSYLNLGEASRYRYYSAADRQDIFFDDFDDNRHGWPYIQVGETWTGRFENGYMVWESRDDQSMFQEKSIAINENDDFEIETRIRYIRGQDDNANSLNWGRNADRCEYSFGVSGNGQYVIRRYDGTWSDYVPWTHSGLIHRTSFNKLTIRKVNASYYFFINEHLIHTMPFEPFWGHTMGIIANANTTIHIDYLRVSTIEKESFNQPPEIVVFEPSMTRGIEIVSTKTVRVRGRAIDPDGIWEVMANGNDAILQSDGSFTVDVPLAIGENTIILIAKDIRLSATEKVLTIRRQAGAVVDTPSLTGEKRLALVIGNSEYVYGGGLANPVNDARSMKQTLEVLGFSVIEYADCTQKTMKIAMDEFGEQLKSYDVGLFFYAGHGLQVRGNNYLIPVDAKLEDVNDVEYDCVRAGRILGKMESAGTRTNIVILDACRDNPFERSWNRGAQGQGLAFMNAPSGSLIAYATSPGTTAADGSGRNGLYTSALLEHIQTPDITIEEVFKRVRTTVRQSSQSKQIPWESTSLEGNFYFKK